MARKYTDAIQTAMETLPLALRDALGIRMNVVTNPADGEEAFGECEVVSDGYDYEALGGLLQELATAWDAYDADTFGHFRSHTKRHIKFRDVEDEERAIPLWVGIAQDQIADARHLLWLVLRGHVTGAEPFQPEHPALAPQLPMLKRIAAEEEHAHTSDEVMGLIEDSYADDLVALLEAHVPSDTIVTPEQFEREYKMLRRHKGEAADHWLAEAYAHKRFWIKEMTGRDPTAYELNCAGVEPHQVDAMLAALGTVGKRLAAYDIETADLMEPIEDERAFEGWRMDINAEVLAGFDRMSPGYARRVARYVGRGNAVMESGAGLMGSMMSRTGVDGVNRNYAALIAINRHYSSLFTTAHELGHMFQLSPGQSHGMFEEFHSQFAENLMYRHSLDGIERKRGALRRIGLGEGDLAEAEHALEKLEAGLLQSQLLNDALVIYKEMPPLHLARRLDAALDGGAFPSLYEAVRETAKAFGLRVGDSAALYADFAEIVTNPDAFLVSFVSNDYSLPWVATRGLMYLCTDDGGRVDDGRLKAMGGRFMQLQNEKRLGLMLPEIVSTLAGCDETGRPYTIDRVLELGVRAIGRDLNRADELAARLGVDMPTHYFEPPYNPVTADHNPQGPARLWKEYARGAVIMR